MGRKKRFGREIWLECERRPGGEKAGEGVDGITLFAVYNLSVDLGNLDAFVAEELAYRVEILLLGKEQGGKSMAGGMESNGLGNTGIAEPLADGYAGAGIAVEVEDRG